VEFQLIKDEEGPVSTGDSFFSYARAQRAEKAERDPIVGDVVHYWDGESCAAAIVTRDDLESQVLAVLPPEGEILYRHMGVAHSEDKSEGSWHWPCGGH
jgi:hypothetical protein